VHDAVKKENCMNRNMRRLPQQRQAPRETLNGINARRQYELYLARAREAQVAGDAVEMENYYQHAEHYLRVLRGDGHERRNDI